MSTATAPIRRNSRRSADDLLSKVDRAIAEVNAPVRSKGPGIMKVGGLIVKEIFHPTPPSNEGKVEHDE